MLNKDINFTKKKTKKLRSRASITWNFDNFEATGNLSGPEKSFFKQQYPELGTKC